MPLNVTSRDFRFKGSRDYVHGTDMFNSLLEILAQNGFGEFDTLSIAYLAIARNCLDFHFGTEDEFKGFTAPLVGRVSARSKDHVLKGGWVETDRKIDGRYDYPEEEIMAAGTMETGRIRLDRPLEFTNIELLVALNKRLVAESFPDEKRKWMFSRLEVRKRFPERGMKSGIDLSLSGNRSSRLVRSSFRIDGQECGDLYFSVLQ